MNHDRFRDSVHRDVVPNRFKTFTALTVMLAVASLLPFVLTTGWDVDAPLRFVLLSIFVMAGELLPIPVPRSGGHDKITISTAFAFALLITSGVPEACLVYAAASVVADLLARTAAIKIVFNAATYVVSLAGAGAMLALLGVSPSGSLHATAVPAILLAGLVCFAINHVLAGVGASLLSRLPVVPYLRKDIAFQAWTAGCLLTFAPGVVASADASLLLIPLAFVPMLAIYFGGRQAGLNAHRALHDQLTELPNRRRLVETLSGALHMAAHSQATLAVMIIDLDDFKAINDTLGHEFGDRLLQQVAPRLSAAIGEGALLARLGGDEFAAVVEDVADDGDALRRAQRLLSALQQPFDVDSLTLHVGGSVGVACFPQHGRTVDELLRHADVAMYCAKSKRSTCAVYAHEEDDHSIDRLALAAQLRRGIERGELVVHYQPKLPLQGQGGCGVEALVRWNHPQLGWIQPDGFIPLAEQTGVIKGLTERVLEVAISQCARWRETGLDVRFSVNVSSRTLLDHDLPQLISTLLRRYSVPAGSLQLEITESRSVADLRRAQTVLLDLRAMGITIAIDDFGTGFSSLSQLQQLPVDEIKIDRSFVMRMETDRDDAVLVRSIIELGRNLGLRVTAEGVETASVHETLRRLGCDFAQGFHLGRPVPAEECRRLLEARPHVMALVA